MKYEFYMLDESTGQEMQVFANEDSWFAMWVRNGQRVPVLDLYKNDSFVNELIKGARELDYEGVTINKYKH